jgi:hypothetical protein
MNSKAIAMNRFLLICLLACISGPLMAQGPASAKEARTEQPPAYEKGWIHIKIYQGEEALPTFQGQFPEAQHGAFPTLAQLAQDYNIYHIRNGAVIDDPVLETFYHCRFRDTKRQAQLMEQLRQLPYVELVEKHPHHRKIYTPNDFNGSSQATWHLRQINARSAWDLSKGSSDIVVAIVDDALYPDHEDIKPNLWVNSDEIPGNNQDDDNDGMVDNINGWDAADEDNTIEGPNGNFSHGTFVASAAGAATDNGKGITSIGFNISIMGIKSTADTNSSASSISHGYDGIQYAVAAGADVINLSWGSSGSSVFGQTIVADARSSGAVVVGGAGNDGVSTPFYPAAYSSVLAVGATNQSDQKYNFSNYGNWLDCMAPGFIIGAGINNPSDYYAAGGTSFSSPIVAGLAGLIKSFNPQMSVSDIENCILNSAKDISTSNPNFVGQLGKGRIDARAALACAEPSRCDSSLLSRFYKGSDQLYKAKGLNPAGSGYPTGTNSFDDQAKAERFNYAPGYDRLLSLRLKFGKVVLNQQGIDVNAVVWGPNNSGTGPGNQIVSRDLDLLAIEKDAQNGDTTVVDFATPVQIPTDFYAGITYTNVSGDTIALYATGPADSATSGYGWEQRGNGDWALLESRWSQPFNLAVFPEVTSEQGLIDVDFSYDLLTNNEVEFKVDSSYPPNTDFLWDFGNQSAGFGRTVTNTYPSEGKYLVDLKVQSKGCTYRTSKEIDVTKLSNRSSPEAYAEQLRLAPNPGDHRLRVHSLAGSPNEALNVTVLNLQGQRIQQTRFKAKPSGRYTLNTSELASGVYILRIQQGDNLAHKRWVKE